MDAVNGCRTGRGSDRPAGEEERPLGSQAGSAPLLSAAYRLVAPHVCGIGAYVCIGPGTPSETSTAVGLKAQP